MISLRLKNNDFKLKVSSLLEGIETLKDKDETSKVNKESLIRENKMLQVQVNDLNARIL